MAGDMMVIMSDTFKGAGLVSGTAFGMEKNMLRYKYSTKEEISAQAIKKAQDLEVDWSLNSLSNLNQSPVYIFSGALDEVVEPVN